MARLKTHGSCLIGDELGAVYFEFLLAFPPLFLLFMAICQLCLAATAQLVVAHAATRAARAAIVILEDDPKHYGETPRGRLSLGQEPPGRDFADLLVGLKLTRSLGLEDRSLVERPADTFRRLTVPQQGARMRPIRNAAYLPLFSLAPRSLDTVQGSAIPNERTDPSLASGLSADFARHGLDSLLYTRAATVVTVNLAPGSTALVAEPVGRNAPVTVRVTYLYRCSVPVVRSLVCRSLQRLISGESKVPSEHPAREWASLERRFELAEDPGRLRELAHDAYFKVIEAEATLPNQGAAYYTSEPEKAP